MMTASMALFDAPPTPLQEPTRVEPVLPGSLNAVGISHLDRAKRQAEDPSVAFAAWYEKALADARKTLRSAEANAHRSSAWTRAAFAFLGLGEHTRAAELAMRSLQASSEEELDVAALYGALRVLWSVDKVDAATPWLDRLPPVPLLMNLRASVAAHAGEFDTALAMLAGSSSPETLSLRGYLYLCRGDIQQAVHVLRSAIRERPQDVDAHLNLGAALQRAGSDRKALTSFAQAWRLSRSRKDVAVAYLELLWVNERWAQLAATITELETTTLSEDHIFIFMQAREALRIDRTERGLRLLSKAATAARNAGDTCAAADALGNAVLVKRSMDRLTQREAWERIQGLAEGNPTSGVLLEMLARVTNRVSEGRRLRTLYEQTDSHMLLPNERHQDLQMRVAYFSGDFQAAVRLSRQWWHALPRSIGALRAMAAVGGHLDDDWQPAATAASALLRRSTNDPYVANQAAYALAMAGSIAAARAALATTTEASYALRATAGLVEICAGNLSTGFQLYRDAFKQAERETRATGSEEDLAVMYLHQQLLLHRLNLSEENDLEVRASALPQVALPLGWADDPGLLALRDRFAREGHEWPHQMV
jgi:tetratricopeptide (TPR) repeat protein